MPKKVVERVPDVPLTALGILCFVTVLMSQIRFKIAREINREVMPPILKNRDCWVFTYSNSDRYKYVLKAVILVTSPIVSLISTWLVLLGQRQLNPYLFLPWITLTLRGLIAVQGNNLIGMLKEVASRSNASSNFNLSDWKWCIFYLTIFIFTVAECFALVEVVDLFKIIWFYRPQYVLEKSGNSKIKYDASLINLEDSSTTSVKLKESGVRKETTELIPRLF